jgi:hypothetical protein
MECVVHDILSTSYNFDYIFFIHLSEYNIQINKYIKPRKISLEEYLSNILGINRTIFSNHLYSIIYI